MCINEMIKTIAETAMEIMKFVSFNNKSGEIVWRFAVIGKIREIGIDIIIKIMLYITPMARE